MNVINKGHICNCTACGNSYNEQEIAALRAELAEVQELVVSYRKQGERLGAELAAAKAREDALRLVILWTLGEGPLDDFPEVPATVTGSPKFWWRTELRKRFDAIAGSK